MSNQDMSRLYSTHLNTPSLILGDCPLKVSVMVLTGVYVVDNDGDEEDEERERAIGEEDTSYTHKRQIAFFKLLLTVLYK